MATDQLHVSIPAGMKARLQQAAADDGRNLSNFVSVALAAYLNAQATTR